jgi:asparagine synthetase B (glutamine-hydrolysing)
MCGLFGWFGERPCGGDEQVGVLSRLLQHRGPDAHSSEVRSPFLNYRVVEWAGRLPRAALLNSREGTLPMRKLAERLLPTQMQRGSKRGFGAPLRAWFQQLSGQTFLRERLLSPEAKSRGFWDVTCVERIIATHLSTGGRDFGPLLWRFLFLDAWSRTYLDTDAFLQGPPAMKPRAGLPPLSMVTDRYFAEIG